jgi:CheY-like chemotaxis protein
VRVLSEPGKGARFEIYWPLAREERKTGAQPQLPAPGESRPAKVLLVEDQRELRQGMVRWLEGSGHSVIAAGTAEQALARFEAAGERVDVVATDVVLPGMDGIELIECLRKRDPALRAIAFSGDLDHLSRTGRLVPEGVPLLDKPFDPRRLGDLIAQLVADDEAQGVST